MPFTRADSIWSWAKFANARKVFSENKLAGNFWQFLWIKLQIHVKKFTLPCSCLLFWSSRKYDSLSFVIIGQTKSTLDRIKLLTLWHVNTHMAMWWERLMFPFNNGICRQNLSVVRRPQFAITLCQNINISDYRYYIYIFIYIYIHNELIEFPPIKMYQTYAHQGLSWTKASPISYMVMYVNMHSANISHTPPGSLFTKRMDVLA